MIKTVPRRGYLCAATVAHSEMGSNAVPAPAVEDSGGLLAGAHLGSDRVVALSGVPAQDQAIAPLALPQRSSIAVLPFTNMSGDPEQGYFVDGVTEEIIIALARFKSIFVIARNSTFTYKGTSPDIRRVGRELGVRYVLDGSVRKFGQRVRVTGQLIDAATATHIWADRYDHSLDDIFALQDRITENIVGAIEPQVLRAEVHRARAMRPDSLAAYDCVLRAYQHLWRLTLEDNEKALGYLHQAIELDPDYALAHAYASWTNLFRIQLTQNGSIRSILVDAFQHAQRAAELDPSDPLIQTIRAAWQLMIERDYDGSVAGHEAAFQNNPNSVWVCGGCAFAQALNRNPDRAIALAERARRLSPIDPSMFLWLPAGAIAHLLAGRDQEAIRWSEEALRLNPRHLISLLFRTAAEIAAGNDKVARQFVGRMLGINPTLDLKFASKMLPLRYPEDKASVVSALKAAGLPE
jgi:TolB-like protein/Flp pilus assembly protein TadD